MAVKTYLDQTGLQYYHSKWQERIADMELTEDDIYDILDDMFFYRNKFKFTVDTQATALGEKTAGIPFNLYGQDTAILNVNWGDGTTSTLTSADYSIGDSRASIHQYDVPGIYQISIENTNWESTYIFTVNSNSAIVDGSGGEPLHNANVPLYWWERTLISVDTAIPKIKGRIYYNSNNYTTVNTRDDDISLLFSQSRNLQSIVGSLFNNNPQMTNFYRCFFYCSSLQLIPPELFNNNTAITTINNCFNYCTSLTSIPSGLFNNCTEITTFNNCFSSCSSLTSIPENLFANHDLVTNFASCFNECTSLNGFTVTISAANVTTAANFCSLKTGVTRTVRVPSGSTTKTTFDAIASSLGLTVVGV